MPSPYICTPSSCALIATIHNIIYYTKWTEITKRFAHLNCFARKLKPTPSQKPNFAENFKLVF